MNIAKAREIAELYRKYEEVKQELERLVGTDVDEQSNEVDEQLNDDYLIMGSPLHRKLEVTLRENDIDRVDLKDYHGIGSMKYITVGSAKNVIDNPDLYRDAIEGWKRR